MDESKAIQEAYLIMGEAREMLVELSDYAHGVRGKALMLTLDHIDDWKRRHAQERHP